MPVTRINATASTCSSAGPSFCAGAGFARGPDQTSSFHQGFGMACWDRLPKTTTAIEVLAGGEELSESRA